MSSGITIIISIATTMLNCSSLLQVVLLVLVPPLPRFAPTQLQNPPRSSLSFMTIRVKTMAMPTEMMTTIYDNDDIDIDTGADDIDEDHLHQHFIPKNSLGVATTVSHQWLDE